MYPFFAFLFIFCVALTIILKSIYYVFIAIMYVIYVIKNKELPNCNLSDLKAPAMWEDW